MKKCSLLSISNSFGVNLQTYASQIAKENGFELDIFVLYIGGCPLIEHSENIKNNAPAYLLYHNGECEKADITILETLKMKRWDYIITQQVSYLAGNYDSYFPYINELLNYVKKNANYGYLGLQETWEYTELFVKDNGEHFTKKESEEMYDSIIKTYKKVSNELDLLLFKSGSTVHKASLSFKKNFYSDDGFHLNKDGCYLIGLNLVKQLFGEKIKKVFVPEGLNKEDIIKYINFVNSLE